jgi:hypothetical protein
MRGSKVLCFQWHPLPIPAPAAALVLTQRSSIASHLLLGTWQRCRFGMASTTALPPAHASPCGFWLSALPAPKPLAGWSSCRPGLQAVVFCAVACASFWISRKHSRHLKMILLCCAGRQLYHDKIQIYLIALEKDGTTNCLFLFLCAPPLGLMFILFSTFICRVVSCLFYAYYA